MVTRDMEQQMHDYLGDIAAETKKTQCSGIIGCQSKKKSDSFIDFVKLY